jgi:hypothetical protein
MKGNNNLSHPKMTHSFFCLIALLFLLSCGGSHNDSSLTLYSELHDFESMKDRSITTEKAFSGKNSAMVNDTIEYGIGLSKRFKDISSYGSIDEVNVSFKCFMDKPYPDAAFVLSIEDGIAPKSLVWEGRPITCEKYNEWSDITYNFKINRQFISPESFIKLYIWNKGKNKFYFDDLSFNFVKIKLK